MDDGYKGHVAHSPRTGWESKPDNRTQRAAQRTIFSRFVNHAHNVSPRDLIHLIPGFDGQPGPALAEAYSTAVTGYPQTPSDNRPALPALRYEWTD